MGHSRSKKGKARILIVDDDVQGVESVRRILSLEGFDVVTAYDGEAALERLRPTLSSMDGDNENSVELVISDLRMPRMGGMELFEAIRLFQSGLPVILMTAYGEVDEAVRAMKLGAVDFLTKPFKRKTLLASVEAALKLARAQDGVKATPVREADSENDDWMGVSAAFLEMKNFVAKIAPSQANVLIVGESGVGKEKVAREIHRGSARAAGPWIALNCAALPETLIESELFGHEKGAFTGASSTKQGLIEAANGGTLFLDEIGDMPMTLQGKLLRVLQEREVRRVGSTSSRQVDVRILAATHRDLRREVREGRFREDLLYRLEVIQVNVPPLRDRAAEDIPLLVQAFLRSSAKKHGRAVRAVSEEVMECLVRHSWPGNIRELSNVIERAVVLAEEDVLRREDLPEHLRTDASLAVLSRRSVSIPVGTSLREVEEILIRKTLEATDGDKTMTARLLGINSRTIYRRLEKKDAETTAAASETPADPRSQ